MPFQYKGLENFVNKRSEEKHHELSLVLAKKQLLRRVHVRLDSQQAPSLTGLGIYFREQDV